MNLRLLFFSLVLAGLVTLVIVLNATISQNTLLGEGARDSSSSWQETHPIVTFQEPTRIDNGSREYPFELRFNASYKGLTLYSGSDVRICNNRAVHVVSFSAGPRHYARLSHWVDDVTKLGRYASVKVYTELDLGPSFVANYDNGTEFFLGSSRGFGFWVWKPYVVRRRLAELPEGDYLIWSDIGNTFVVDGLNELCRDLAQIDSLPKTPWAAFDIGHKEGQWTRNDVFNRFGRLRDARLYNTGQICATYFLIKNTKTSRALIREWELLAMVDEGRNFRDVLTSDDYAYFSKRYDGFVTDESRPGGMFNDHRHDQSSWSLLLKTRWGVGVLGRNRPAWVVDNREKTI